MNALGALVICALFGAGYQSAQAAEATDCDAFKIDGKASTPLRNVSLPPAQACKVRISNGFPLPDPNCTPGASNPTLTVSVLRDPNFRTGCVRDDVTSESMKAERRIHSAGHGA